MWMIKETEAKTLACKWTNGGGEVLILKCVHGDGKTYNGFQWPLRVGAAVESPNWGEDATCESGGLFGWPWGLAVGDGKDPDWGATWIVFGALPEDIVDLGGKCKARRGTIRFVGTFHDAHEFILPGQMAFVFHDASGSASNSGWRGSASNSGARGSASNSGTSGSASNSGWSGSASNSGTSGSASNSGWRGSASTMSPGTAAICTGLQSRASASAFGCIALAWRNVNKNRTEMRCAEIGSGDGSDGKLKANVWYRLGEDGQFVEEPEARNDQ